MQPQADNAPMPELPKHKLRLHIDLRLLVILLVITIGVMLFLWKPWSAKYTNTSRTIQVTGSATIKSEPDEYVFSPTYEFKNTDKTKGLADMTAKSNDVVAALKKLGVADKSIKTNASDYNLYYTYENGQNVYNLNLTVTVNDKTLAQKVQDYLITTSPTGEITPEANFSDTKQKQLESDARSQAENDARSKAEKSAKNIGFKLGAVKTVTEDSGFDTGGVCGGLCRGSNAVNIQSGGSTNSLSVQPGENDLTYSVDVTYYIK